MYYSCGSSTLGGKRKLEEAERGKEEVGVKLAMTEVEIRRLSALVESLRGEKTEVEAKAGREIEVLRAEL